MNIMNNVFDKSSGESLQKLSEISVKALIRLKDPLVIFNPYIDSIVLANQAACRLIGWSQDELLGKKASSLFAEQLSGLIIITQAAIELGNVWNDELSIVLSNGQRRSVEISAFSIEDLDQTLIGILLRDHNELKFLRERSEISRYYRGGLMHWRRVEEVFREIERENQLILKAAGEGIYGVNADGMTTFLNPAAERMLDWKASELVGKNIHEAIHHSYPNGKLYPGHKCPIYAAFRDGAIHRVNDEVFFRKDGTGFAVEYTSTPILDNGNLVGAVVVFRDITERLSTEVKLRQALKEVDELTQRLKMENAYLQEEIRAEHNHHQIVGTSPEILNIIRQIELVAPTDAPVLITGESGTGKELIAHAIHEASARNQRPLIRVNCAAIPRELFESEFFGHIKGAFTGAFISRVGRFELADGGTLFLDEVGEIPIELQSKLLRVLQDQQFEKVGTSETKKVDVRIIAATNRDLKKNIAEKAFREDLYFRINVFPIELPPLRQRLKDVPLLAKQFLQLASQKFNKPSLQLSLANIDALQNYHWPGNIRELHNVIERQVIVSRDGKLHFDLPRLSDTGTSHAVETPEPLVNKSVDLMKEDERRLLERENIKMALRKTGGKVFGPGGAADLLGIKPTTLASRIKRWGIEP
jgi:formate hydrogenlyase transcriptional activator